MPKRKRNSKEDDNVTKKLQKIEKMLKQCKSSGRKRIISSSSEGSSQSLNNHSDGEIRSPPLNDSEIDSIINENRHQAQTNYNDITTTPTALHTLLTSQPPPLLLEAGPSTSHEKPVPSTSQETEQVPDGQPTSPVEDSLDKDILEILGEDPTVAEVFAKSIRPELATRFNHIATNGLNKDTRKETVLKRDKLIEYRQKRLAAAISCLGEALSHALEAKDKNNAQIKRLMDTARLLCDAQHSDSVSRRTLAVSSLKKEMKDPLLNTKIDKSLFGENLVDSLKSAKAVSKSGTDLKNQNKLAPTKNWRAPVAGRRPPATPQGRRNTPAAPTTPAQPAAPWPRPSLEPRGARTQSSRRPLPPPPRSTRRRY